MTVPEGATKFALHEPYVPASGTKIALHTPPHCMCGIKLALLARNGPFWRVSCVQGELCTALATNNPSRANFVPHTRWMRSQSTQPHTKCHRYGGCRRDRRARPRCPWAVAGPGCGAHGRWRAWPVFEPTRNTISTPGTAGVKGAGGSGGPGCGAHGRRLCLAWLRDTSCRRCGGRRIAWPRCRWVEAGPGRASRSTTPSRRLACGDLAGWPPPTGTHSGPVGRGGLCGMHSAQVR